MATEPRPDDLTPEMGSRARMAEKAFWILIVLPLVAVFMLIGRSLFGLAGAMVGAAFGCLLSGIARWLIGKYRVFSFKRKRGD